MPTKRITEIDFASDLDFSEILTNPILDIAARFWEDNRYDAFKICYRSMRLMDDLVDDRKAIGTDLSSEEKVYFSGILGRWLDALNDKSPTNPLHKELLETIERFAIPHWPWERLTEAMRYDLYHDGFANFITFVRYARGAAVAPASIFMHLCGITETGSPPTFDIRKAARPLALFSYLVHIVRDFEKDHLAGLNYFADSHLREHQLSRIDLLEIAKGGEIPDKFRSLIRIYKRLADHYRRRARRMIDDISPQLTPRYHLSLEVIYDLYLHIFERINPDTGLFTGAELNPSPAEIQQRIDEMINRFRLQS